MTNLQACLSYLSGAGFDRETLKTAREAAARRIDGMSPRIRSAATSLVVRALKRP